MRSALTVPEQTTPKAVYHCYWRVYSLSSLFNNWQLRSLLESMVGIDYFFILAPPWENLILLDAFESGHFHFDINSYHAKAKYTLFWKQSRSRSAGFSITNAPMWYADVHNGQCLSCTRSVNCISNIFKRSFNPTCEGYLLGSSPPLLCLASLRHSSSNSFSVSFISSERRLNHAYKHTGFIHASLDQWQRIRKDLIKVIL